MFLKIYAKSDKGLIRESNQDMVSFDYLDNSLSWILVCDGMGGQSSGDIASKLASEVIRNVINNNYSDYSEKFEEDCYIDELMYECLNSANTAIFNKSLEDEKYKSMGTTAVLAFLKNDDIYISYVGDSRAYIVSSKVEQITTDHSMVQEMVNKGEITKEEAKKHPKKNIITRAVGVKPEIRIDHIKRKFVKGESLLICTDGFSNLVDERSILEYFSNFEGEDLVNRLVEHANNAGGNDNITVAIVTR